MPVLDEGWGKCAFGVWGRLGIGRNRRGCSGVVRIKKERQYKQDKDCVYHTDEEDQCNHGKREREKKKSRC